ncbi:MAG TPA: non-homologous end-joining DNA ligase [Actinomycetota bacterium]|nr:non-homologous end-joining DNA ligase [Actinomycetota bacterium]
MAPVTTIDFPVELPVLKRGEHWIARAGDRELRLSNLDKIFWPKERYTKGDLITYYFNISPVMLPHLENRPLTLKRMPNGVEGPFFYEKNAPSHRPEWMPTIPVKADGGTKIINFLTVTDVAHMLWIANLGCIEFHPLHAKGSDQSRSSYAFFDLDPFEPATWDDVMHVAHLIKVVLDRFEIGSYPKTSGATGLQIMIPLTGEQTYDEVRGFVGTISEMVHAADPSTTTLEWEVSKRTGKVFLDVNMNREGANIAAAYSVRPEPGATVSTPFSWDESDDIRPEYFTMSTIFDRVAEVGDPFLPVATGPGYSLEHAIKDLNARPRKARVIRA